MPTKTLRKLDPDALVNVPAALREMPQWVCWTSDKMPVSPADGKPAKANDPSTWGTLTQALARYRGDSSLFGVGLELGRPVVGIDLDHAAQDGKLAPWACAVLDRFETYAEWSPSGTGVHILLLAPDAPASLKRADYPVAGAGVEFYPERRYFTVTGMPVPGASSDVADCSEALLSWLEEVRPKTQAPAPQPRAAGPRASEFERAEAYFAKIEPAVEGQHGDDATYRAACVLVRDFDLSDSQAMEIFSRWNATCRPPWSESDLLAKLASARRNANGTPGSKANAPMPERRYPRHDSAPQERAFSTEPPPDPAPLPAEPIGTLPPQDIEAEITLLRICLRDSANVRKAGAIVAPASFYRTAHAAAFSAMLQLAQAREPIDQITLRAALERGGLDGAGDVVAELARAAGGDAEALARIVQEKFIRRQILTLGSRLQSSAQDPQAEVEQVLRRSVDALLALLGTGKRSHLVTARDLMFEWGKLLESGPTDLNAARATGLSWLDDKIGGLMDGELQYWGGAPGSGKTLAMLQSAYYQARRLQPVLVLSMELGRKRVAQRLAAIDSRVGSQIIQCGPENVFAERAGELFAAVARISEFPLFSAFGSIATWDAATLIQEVTAIAHRKPIVYVDRLEKWADKDVSSLQPKDRIGALSRRTHSIAAQYDLPVVCLVQLNRAGRLAEVPTMECFRDSGDVEQDCQVGVIIRTDKKAKRSTFHVVKQNDGPEGACEDVLFDDTIPAFYALNRHVAPIDTRHRNPHDRLQEVHS